MSVTKKLPNLSALESQLMSVVWINTPATVRAVLEALSSKRRLAYTTVMTVLNRLCEKGVLKRKRGLDGAFRYAPLLPKPAYEATIARQTIDALMRDYGGIAVTQFLDALKRQDRRKLQAWRRDLRSL